MNHIFYIVLIFTSLKFGLFAQQPKAIEVQTGIGKTSIKVYPGVKSAEVFSPEEKRFALVLGVSDYDYLNPLPCVKNDVDTVRRVMQKAGFDVAVALDKTKNEFEAIIDESRQYCIDNGYNVISLYYSGHGAQFGNIQMLAPKDFIYMATDTSGRLKEFMDKSILLPTVIGKLNIPNAKAVLAISDACRSEDYAKQNTESPQIPTSLILKFSNIQKTLEGTGNVGVLYSSINGETSATAPVISLFTQYFLRALNNKPGNFGDLAIRISKEMKDKGEKQKPVNTNNPIDYDFKFFRTTFIEPSYPGDIPPPGWFNFSSDSTQGGGITPGDIKTIIVGSYAVKAIAISPNGKTVITGNGDATLKLFDIATGECLRTFKGHRSDVLSVAISPDGKTAVSGSNEIDNDALKLWDLSTGNCIKTFKGQTGNVKSVAYSPDGKKILTGSNDNTAKLWDITSGQCILTLKEHTNNNVDGTLLQLNSINSVAFSPDGKTILSGGSDGTIKLWNITNGLCTKTFVGHNFGVKSIALSSDGKILLSGDIDGTIKLWIIATGQCVLTIKAHDDSVNSVAFSPNRTTVLSGSDDKTVRLWDIATGKCIKTFTEHNAAIYSVAYSPDGRTALSGADDSTLKLWDVSK